MKEFSSSDPQAMAPSSPFADLEAAARAQLQSLWADAALRHARLVRRSQNALTDRWNQTVRRLRHTSTSAEWCGVLVEAARLFCANAAVCYPEDVGAAPALEEVIRSRDTVVALRDASQLPESLLAATSPSSATRCYLFPVLAGVTLHAPIAAILYADSGSADDLDRSGLELLAALAAGTLPTDPSAAKAADGLLAITPLLAGAKPRLVPYSDAPRHYAAQRFARVRVAEWLLHAQQEVARGRGENRIYRALEQPFEAARREFRARFVEPCPSMADYLHEEAVCRLAQNDVSRLGSEYPGPLV